MKAPGSLLASGRDSEIFDYGPGLVLRRSRQRRSLEKEAKVMRYVSEHGYPAPRVGELSADGADLVMERIEGPTMLAVMMRRPWTVRRHAGTLAALHRRLHRLRAPEWLGSFGRGGDDRLLHLDLHPLNVILSPRGPVLIDWTNASRGAAAADVALTWLLMASAEIPGSRLQGALGGVLRRMFVRSFLAHFDRGEARAALPAVVEWKCRDRNMRPSEIETMQRLLREESGVR
jgi:aminoglycoside phosphotransferase (APT) family kinase protein